eukprot:CAMPEP_0168782068 /NCGR_PEP_ID=MMETSP0725-20121227/8968_1 /TAXON_ID=265536 /ORGANISM="Amphiprora sp., Strain CCMP467" /LENGTH=355 /DNA_ID=CAMNT_0008831979 /DNA_START=23 /DNA_END=1090 /DNA_ORIENTATION=+
MATNSNSNDNGNDLPWYDYIPAQLWVPEHVTHLRIGFQEALVAAQNGSTPEIIDLQSHFCRRHPNLQQVQIHAHTVKWVPVLAFNRCLGLQKVEFVAANTGPSSIAAATTATTTVASDPPVERTFRGIDDSAFTGCIKLRAIIGLETVSFSLGYIADHAFQSCDKLMTFEFSGLTELHNLADYAFYDCTSLTVVDLSHSVWLDSMGEFAFSNCKALMMVHLPPKLEWIGSCLFRECSSLGSIVIPALVTRMDRQVFGNCSSLAQVTFQSTQHLRTLMNNKQFLGCESLDTLKLEGPFIPRELWPLLLKQFLQEGNGILAQAGIPNKQCITIAWNFVRVNIANFYIEEKKPAYCQK